MAKVQVQVTGGAIQQKDAFNVAALKAQMAASGSNVKYTATVNGEPAEDTQNLSDYDFVTLTEQVKGA